MPNLYCMTIAKALTAVCAAFLLVLLVSPDASSAWWLRTVNVFRPRPPTSTPPPPSSASATLGRPLNRSGTTELMWQWLPSTPEHTHEAALFVHNALIRTTSGMPNITLVTHATLDRLPHAVRWCHQYRGPMSLAIFIRPAQDDAMEVVSAFLRDGCIRRHADVHVTREAPSTQDADVSQPERPEDASTFEPKDMMTHYPFNTQRNAAVRGCRGDLMLLVDIDFVMFPAEPQPKEERIRAHYWAQRTWMRDAWTPDRLGWGPQGTSSAAATSAATYERLLRRLSPHSPSHGTLSAAVSKFMAPAMDDVLDAAVFVIPAVESVHANVSLPVSMEALRVAVAEHRVCSFYGHYCRTCHVPTDLEQFLRSETPYRVAYQEGYEPYVILNRSSVGRSFGGTAPPSSVNEESPCAASHQPSVAGCDAPLPPHVPVYDEAFVGRGWDKMSFFYELEAQRRPLIVMSAGFFMGHRGRGDMPKVLTAEYKARQVVNRDAMQRFKENTRRTYRPITAPLTPTADDMGGWMSYHLRHQPTWLPLHDHPVVQAMTTTLGRDIDLLVPLLRAQVPQLMHDPLLWNASSNRSAWSVYASSAQFPGGATQHSAPPPPTARGAPVVAAALRVTMTCIAKGRPRSMLDPTFAGTHDDDDVEAAPTQQLVDALAFVCGAGVDCAALQPLPQSLAPRRHPLSVYAHADYAMDRWFHHALRRGESPERACSFGGAAMLVRFDPLVHLRPRFVGCGIRPEAALRASQMHDLLLHICEGRGGAWDALSPEGCRDVVERMHPAMRDNLRLQLSVLLTAHHLVYEAGGAGCTCACRFGRDVGWVHV